MWIAVTGLLSFLSGWHKLAANFRSDEPLDGESFRYAYATFAKGGLPVGYRGCVFAIVGSRGIAMWLLFPFRFLHPRLVVPWTEVEKCERVTHWLVKQVAVDIKGFDRRVMFSGHLGSRVLDAWQRRKP